MRTNIIVAATLDDLDKPKQPQPMRGSFAPQPPPQPPAPAPQEPEIPDEFLMMPPQHQGEPPKTNVGLDPTKIEHSKDPINQKVAKWRTLPNGPEKERLAEEIFYTPISTGDTLLQYTKDILRRNKKDSNDNSAMSLIMRGMMPPVSNKTLVSPTGKFVGEKHDPKGGVIDVLRPETELSGATHDIVKYVNFYATQEERDSGTQQDSSTARAISKFGPYLRGEKPIPPDIDENPSLDRYQKVLMAYQRDAWDRGKPGRVDAAKQWWDRTYNALKPYITEPLNYSLVNSGRHGTSGSQLYGMSTAFDNFLAHAKDDPRLQDIANKIGLDPKKYGPNGEYELTPEMIWPAWQQVTRDWVRKADMGIGKGTKSIDTTYEGKDDTAKMEYADPNATPATKSTLVEQHGTEPEGEVDRLEGFIPQVSQMAASSDPTPYLRDTVAPVIQEQVDGMKTLAEINEYKNSDSFRALLSAAGDFADEIMRPIRTRERQVKIQMEKMGLDPNAPVAPPAPAPAATPAMPEPQLPPNPKKEKRVLPFDEYLLRPKDPDNPLAVFDDPTGEKAQPYMERLSPQERTNFLQRVDPTNHKSPRPADLLSADEPEWRKKGLPPWRNVMSTLADKVYPDNPLLNRVAKEIGSRSQLLKGYTGRNTRRAFEPMLDWFRDNAALFNDPQRGGLWQSIPEEKGRRLDNKAKFRWAVGKVMEDFMKALSDGETFKSIMSPTTAATILKEIRVARMVLMSHLTKAG